MGPSTAQNMLLLPLTNTDHSKCLSGGGRCATSRATSQSPLRALGERAVPTLLYTGQLLPITVAYTEAGLPVRPVAVLREGLDLDPKDGLLWSQMAYNETWAGNEAGALQACARYEAIVGPREPNAWDTRGFVLFVFGRNQEAVEAYRKLQELKPEFGGHIATQALAVIYLDSGNLTAARQQIDRYREEETGAEGRLIAGMLEAQLLETQGDPEGSLEIYRRLVVQLARAGSDQEASDALMNMGINSLFLGRGKSTLAFAKMQNLHGKELWPITWLQALTGDEAAAQRTREKVLALRPLAPAEMKKATACFRALTSLGRGDVITALEAWAPLPWGCSPIFRARAYLLARDYANAERWLQLVIVRHHWVSGGIRGRSPMREDVAHFYLGQVYEATGKHGDAIREYRSFLSHYTKSRSRLPQIAEARTALKRLGG